MRRLYKGFMAGALTAAMLFAPVDVAAAKTPAVVQTEDGEQDATDYCVSFDANKGKKVKSTRTLSYGDTYGRLPKTTRTGYQFQGWYTKKTGGRKVTAKSVFKGKDDQVLYAHWKKVVTENPQTSETPEMPEAETGTETEIKETSQTPVQETPEDQSETPDTEALLPVSGQTLVSYTPNIQTDYKANDYSGFLVLKNFKPKYLYCQYDYDRFISGGRNVGCTATADAMLASVYMDKSFSPNDEGWITGVGATWTNSVLVDGSKSFSVKQQCQAVYDYLHEGKPVLIRVTGHTVTAIGLRKGVERTSILPSDILIADPTDAKVKCADEMGYRVMQDAPRMGLRIPKTSLPAK